MCVRAHAGGNSARHACKTAACCDLTFALGSGGGLDEQGQCQRGNNNKDTRRHRACGLRERAQAAAGVREFGGWGQTGATSTNELSLRGQRGTPTPACDIMAASLRVASESPSTVPVLKVRFHSAPAHCCFGLASVSTVASQWETV